MGEQRTGKAAGGAAATTGGTLTERLARCYTGAVHDVLRMMGRDDAHRDVLMADEILRQVRDEPGDRVAGPERIGGGHETDAGRSHGRRLAGSGGVVT